MFSTSKISKLLLAGVLLGAGAAQAGSPSAAPEVPGAWYAERIETVPMARGAAGPVFPTAAYEHGPAGHHPLLSPTVARPTMAGGQRPFPASPNESGSFL